MDTLYFMMQVDKHATKTKPWAALLIQMLQYCAVVIDPIVYISFHEKYRKAIKDLLYSWTGRRFAILDTIMPTPELDSNTRVSEPARAPVNRPASAKSEPKT